MSRKMCAAAVAVTASVQGWPSASPWVGAPTPPASSPYEHTPTCRAAEEPLLRVTTVYPGRTDTDMQRAVRASEGGEYEPDRYLRPESVAATVLAAVHAGPDAHLTRADRAPRLPALIGFSCLGAAAGKHGGGAGCGSR